MGVNMYRKGSKSSLNTKKLSKIAVFEGQFEKNNQFFKFDMKITYLMLMLKLYNLNLFLSHIIRLL